MQDLWFILKIAAGVALGMYFWELIQTHVLGIKKYASNMFGNYPYTITESLSEIQKKTTEKYGIGQKDPEYYLKGIKGDSHDESGR